MKTAVTILQGLVRIIGLILIVLGILFWTNNANALVPVHMLLGITLVLLLWTLAILGAVARAQPALVTVALAWGVIVPILGVVQRQLLPGSPHWIIQVAHLLVGLVAIGLAGTLARRVGERISSRDATRQTGALEGAG